MTHGGRTVGVAVGYDPDDLRVLEVFASARVKVGSEMAALPDDGAVMISRCLQYDSDATVAASLGREGHIADPAAPAPPASSLGLLARVALDVQTEPDGLTDAARKYPAWQTERDRAPADARQRIVGEGDTLGDAVDHSRLPSPRRRPEGAMRHDRRHSHHPAAVVAPGQRPVRRGISRCRRIRGDPAGRVRGADAVPTVSACYRDTGGTDFHQPVSLPFAVVIHDAAAFAVLERHGMAYHTTFDRPPAGDDRQGPGAWPRWWHGRAGGRDPVALQQLDPLQQFDQGGDHRRLPDQGREHPFQDIGLLRRDVGLNSGDVRTLRGDVGLQVRLDAGESRIEIVPRHQVAAERVVRRLGDANGLLAREAGRFKPAGQLQGVESGEGHPRTMPRLTGGGNRYTLTMALEPSYGAAIRPRQSGGFFMSSRWREAGRGNAPACPYTGFTSCRLGDLNTLLAAFSNACRKAVMTDAKGPRAPESIPPSNNVVILPGAMTAARLLELASGPPAAGDDVATAWRLVRDIHADDGADILGPGGRHRLPVPRPGPCAAAG